MTETYWNREPVEVERVRVKIADDPSFPRYWARERGLVGQMRNAIKVQYHDEVFYLDDEDPDGCGWDKVTTGLGSPQWGHRGITPDGPVEPTEE